MTQGKMARSCGLVAVMLTVTLSLSGKGPGEDDALTALAARAALGQLDALAGQRLATFRQKVAAQRLAAWGSLARGLAASLANDRPSAGAALREAVQSPWAVELANAHLPVPLDQIIRKCPGGASTATTAADSNCELCGGTGKADCARCSGAGQVSCPDCQGRGGTRWSRCATCKGTGFVTCPKCDGAGTIRCSCTGAQADGGDKESPPEHGKSLFDPTQVNAVRYTIFLAEQLRSGATDIYSASGLKPSPLAARRSAPPEAPRPTSPTPAALPATGPLLRQWAAAAKASSEFGHPSWGAVQATGAPNTLWLGDQPTAWASRDPDGGEEWLELTYMAAVYPVRVRICETYNPGAVVKVESRDTRGQWHTVWKGKDTTAECPGWLEIPIAKADWTCQVIKVTLDTTAVKGWNEIDAVELLGQRFAPRIPGQPE